MKVTIGDYPRVLYFRIHTYYMLRKYGSDWPEDQSWFENLLEWIEDVLCAFFDATINRVLIRRKRKIKVRIDDYDLREIEETLSHIILPMLLKIQEGLMVIPNVDPADVPADLSDPEQWQWVMNEMIYAFESLSDDELLHKYFPMGDEEWLSDEYQEHTNRVRNGIRLFGKYMPEMWM